MESDVLAKYSTDDVEQLPRGAPNIFEWAGRAM